MQRDPVAEILRLYQRLTAAERVQFHAAVTSPARPIPTADEQARRSIGVDNLRQFEALKRGGA